MLSVEYASYSDQDKGNCESREEAFDQYYKNRGEMYWTENINVARRGTVERTSNRMSFNRPEFYQKGRFRQV